MADESVPIPARQSSSVQTVSETILPAPEPPRARLVAPLLVGAAVCVLLAGGLLAASLIVVPYYAVSPGSAEGVAERVVVTDGPSYPSAGEIYLMTVRLRRATAMGAFLGWLDPDTDVFKEEAIKPPDARPGRVP